MHKVAAEVYNSHPPRPYMESLKNSATPTNERNIRTHRITLVMDACVIAVSLARSTVRKEGV